MPAAGASARAKSAVNRRTSSASLDNPNNPADIEQDGVQYGAVANQYEIGKFEGHRRRDRTEFLNARAGSDPFGLYR